MKPIVPGLTFGVYTVEGKLGEGGMAEVWECHHHRLGRSVAIKFLKASLAQTEAGRQRFFDEAQALAKIDSEFVVRIFDCSETPDGSPYIAMERLVGRTLREHLDHEGRLPEASALWLVSDACRGVEAAHRAGLIHRDIKPGNLFISNRGGREPTCKLLDFGIAKGIGELPTKDGVLVGTVSYMSPEQARSEPSSPRTDIYALGVVLFEAVAGVPFVGGSTEEAQLLRILNGERDGVEWANVSPRVASIVKRATAFQASERFESVAALARELENAAMAISGGERPDTGAVTVRFVSANPASRSRPFAIALGLLAAASFGVVGGFVWASGTVGAGDKTEEPKSLHTVAQTEPIPPTFAAVEQTSTHDSNESRAVSLPGEPQKTVQRATGHPKTTAAVPLAARPRTKVTIPDAPEQNTKTSTLEAPAESHAVGGFVVRNPYRRAASATSSFP